MFTELKTSLLGAALCVALVGTANAAPLDDARIIAIYLQVNTFDIETALVARAQTESDSVRQFAEHVSSDHLGVRQAAMALAAQCKVEPLLPASRQTNAVEHDKWLMKLLALKGAAADKAYLEHVLVFHREAIGAVRTVLLPAAKCPALQAHFKQVLPAFEEHLAHAEMVARQIGAN